MIDGRIPCYADRVTVDAATLADIPRLIRYAWDHALLFPEFGDEIMEDLQADVERIAARDGEARVADRARRLAIRALQSAEEIAEDALTGLNADSFEGGIDPHGFFVYLLWGDDDHLPLYVGRSQSLFVRLGSHMGDAEKRSRVRKVTLIRCRTYSQMCKTELRLIRRYRPELNTAGLR